MSKIFGSGWCQSHLLSRSVDRVEVMKIDDIIVTDHGNPVSHIVFRSGLDGLPVLTCGSSHVFIVYDRNVKSYADRIIRDISPVSSLGLDTSEFLKTVSTVTEICSWLLETGADRDALLLAVGGGILTDMAGFSAAIYKRGIRAAYVPTTLLAQVDASVGGKTGVNFLDYKNILGVIRQPEFTFVCPEVLLGLPYGQILEGAAEMLKTFIIKDCGNYSRAVEFFRGLHESVDRKTYLEEHLDELEFLVYASVDVKAGIVSADQFESGIRRRLNLGHTFAHAIEWKDHSISHGRAVSIGIVCAAVLSEAMGLCRPGLASRIASDLALCGLDTELPFPADSLVDAMQKDKKAEGGKINFIVINDIGATDVLQLSAGSAVKTINNKTKL